MLKKTLKLLVLFISLYVAGGNAVLLVTHDDAKNLFGEGSIPYCEEKLENLFEKQERRVRHSYNNDYTKPIECRVKSVIESCCNTQATYTSAQVIGLLDRLAFFNKCAEDDLEFVKLNFEVWLENNQEVPKQLLLMLLNHLDYSFPVKDHVDILTLATHMHDAEDLLNSSILLRSFSKDHPYDETIFHDASKELQLFYSVACRKKEDSMFAELLMPLFIKSCLNFCQDMRAKSAQGVAAVCSAMLPIPEKIHTLSPCCLCEKAPLNKRLAMVIKVVKTVVKKHPNMMKSLVITSVASGGCFLELLILSMLLELGYKDITLACIDPLYEVDPEGGDCEGITEIEKELGKLPGVAQIHVEKHGSLDIPSVDRKVLVDACNASGDARVTVAFFPINSAYQNAVNAGFSESTVFICIDPTKMASCVMRHLMKDDSVVQVGADCISLEFAEVRHSVKVCDAR